MNAHEALGCDLRAAIGRRITRRAHKRRMVAVLSLSAAFVGVLSTAALASGMLPGFDLDPTKWEILGRGEVDGRASYINARERQTGNEATFLEERDAGMDRYDAFLLNRQVRSAAGLPLEAGAVCATAEVTRAEIVALETVAAVGPPGLPRDAATADVDAALKSFDCSGVGYAGERARWVYARDEPVAMLMPGARETARRVLGE